MISSSAHRSILVLLFFSLIITACTQPQVDEISVEEAVAATQTAIAVSSLAPVHEEPVIESDNADQEKDTTGSVEPAHVDPLEDENPCESLGRFLTTEERITLQQVITEPGPETQCEVHANVQVEAMWHAYNMAISQGWTELYASTSTTDKFQEFFTEKEGTVLRLVLHWMMGESTYLTQENCDFLAFALLDTFALPSVGPSIVEPPDVREKACLVIIENMNLGGDAAIVDILKEGGWIEDPDFSGGGPYVHLYGFRIDNSLVMLEFRGPEFGD